MTRKKPSIKRIRSLRERILAELQTLGRQSDALLLAQKEMESPEYQRLLRMQKDLQGHLHRLRNKLSRKPKSINIIELKLAARASELARLAKEELIKQQALERLTQQAAASGNTPNDSTLRDRLHTIRVGITKKQLSVRCMERDLRLVQTEWRVLKEANVIKSAKLAEIEKGIQDHLASVNKFMQV